MQTRGRSPKLFPIVYCTLRSLYSGNLPTLKIRTLKSRPNGQNQYEFPSESGQSHARSILMLV